MFFSCSHTLKTSCEAWAYICRAALKEVHYRVIYDYLHKSQLYNLHRGNNLSFCLYAQNHWTLPWSTTSNVYRMFGLQVRRQSLRIYGESVLNFWLFKSEKSSVRKIPLWISFWFFIPVLFLRIRMYLQICIHIHWKQNVFSISTIK